MCNRVYFLPLLLLLLFTDDVNSLCTNRTALNSVTATVHDDLASPGKTLSGNFYLFENLAVIHVFRANVTDLCEGMVKNLPKLEVLSLITVNLSIIQPNSLQNLKKLKELSLAVNSLTEISKGIFSTLPSLEILYLSSNQISHIEEDAFAHMPNLKTVHLDRNKLVAINGNLFRQCPKIRTVDFRFNQIQNIGENSFSDLRPINKASIAILLGKNRISDISSDAFRDLNPVLLHLERNKLRLSETSTIQLFHAVSEWSQIYLDGNEFTCVPEELIQEMRNTTKHFSIQENPLTCECIDYLDKLSESEIFGKQQLVYSTTFPCDVTHFNFFQR